MTAILLDDGDLLVPVGACITAERIRPGDQRYESLLAESVSAAALRSTAEEDAMIAARFERRYRDREPRSA